MRPEIILPLFASVDALEGVGPRVRGLLHKVVRLPSTISAPRIIDLLWHAPTGVIDRRAQPSVSAAVPGTIATLRLRVLKHKPPRSRQSKVPYRVTCEDDTGAIDLIFFKADRRYLERALPIAEERIVSGRIEQYAEILQIPHPDYVLPLDQAETLPFLEPVYPLTAGLSGKVLAKAIRQALDRLPTLDNWHDQALLEREEWPTFATALTRMHRPTEPSDLSPTGKAWQRLAYDELLANQLALAIVRQTVRETKGRSIVGNGSIANRIYEALPFLLTPSQNEALSEIADDMAAPHRMLRLLQGDVGSGKTVVALLTMVIGVEAGAQAALMAPTEVLARQHMETIEPLAKAADLRVALLTGREKGRPRKEILSRLVAGELDILIGTHALFQADVVFRDLAIAIIDEQHRFGVHQRLALQSKGGPYGADVLVMTATPIPRTLLMTHYGDLDVSRLTEKPAGRKPIATRAVPLERIEEIIQGLARAINSGAQVYWVCPLVEDSDKIDLAAAEERFAHLQQYFGNRVGLVHGQMTGRAKDAAMEAFSSGKLAILVSTTVIEVGVDVPNASIMVIEHAERFGLAQLHQLRGRVGRGERSSSCILLYHGTLSATAKARIETMRETDDGFVIAEEDLRLRGGGEVLGSRQSGMPDFRIAHVPNFEELLAMARDDATLIIQGDATLNGPRGAALRTLLYLFDCDEAVSLFRAG